MGEIETEVRLKLDVGGGQLGGSYGGLTPLLRGTFELPEVTLTFKSPVCTKHDRQAAYNFAGEQSCPACDADMTKIATEVVEQAFFALSRDQGIVEAKHGLVDCSNVWHSHNCECHLGHRCEMGCKVFDRADEEGPDARHALYQLADEAASAGVANLHQRMFKLEKENADLRDKLEETAKLVRDLHEIARGAAGVQAT